MFNLLLENNFVDEVLERAKVHVREERNKLEEVFDIILKYCKKYKALISNIDYLIGKHEYWEVIEIYSNESKSCSSDIFVGLCERFGEHFVLQAKEEENEYEIFYEIRKICSIYPFGIADDTISETKFEDNYVLPPEIELINLYSQLYNPKFASDWEKISSNITLIENKLIENGLTENGLTENKLIETKSKKTAKVSAKNSTKTSIKTSIKTSAKNFETEKKSNSKCDQILMRGLMNLKIMIMDFLNKTDYILLGDVVEKLNNCKSIDGICLEDLDVIEIISKNDLETDTKMLNNLVSKYSDYSMVVEEANLQLIKDYQAKKYVVSVIAKKGNKSTKIPIIFLYNNSSYELIPFQTFSNKKYSYKIADPIVNVRFVYINLWRNKISSKTGKETSEETSEEIGKSSISNKKLMDLLSYFSSKIDIYEVKSNYEGIFSDKIIEKKINLNQSAPMTKFYCNEKKLI
jgi:hypothetical protein